MGRGTRTPATGPRPLPDRALQRLAEVAAVVLVIVVPLVWDVGAASPFRGPKQSLALAAWLALAGVFSAWSSRAAWRDPWLWPWAGVVAAGAVSAVASAQPARAAFALLPVLLAGAGVAALRMLPEVSRLRLRALVVTSGVVQAVLALAFRLPEVQPASFRALQAATGRFAIVGTLGNPGDVAVFLALPTVLATALALENRRRRGLLAAAAIVMAGAAVSTATVSVVGAVAVGAALLLAGRLAPRARVVALAVLAGALLLAAAVGPLSQRVHDVGEQIKRGDWLWFGSGRAVSFAAALAMLASRPLTGVGFGLFGAESFRFQSEEALAVRGRVLDLVTGFGEAHSEPLQFAAETGAVGVLLLLGAGVVAWRRGARLGRLVPAPGALALVALLVAAAQFPLHLPSVAAQWAVLLALALPPLPPRGYAGRKAWVALALALIVAAGGAGVAWKRYRALRAIGAAESIVRAIRAGELGAQSAALAAAALPRLQAHLRWLPYSVPGELAAGNLAIEARRPDEALRHFTRALALGERPEARFDVGMTLLLLGDREAGFDHLLRAVKLNPAVLKRVEDPGLARELRRRLDADGYGRRHPWIYVDTLAATP